MKENLEELARLISLSYGQLLRITDHDAGRELQEGKWSFKEVLGHLIDSASNNHQRIVRAILEPAVNFPPYQQNPWAEAQHYRLRPWVELVSLWRCYNLHLLHVISHIPEVSLSHRITLEGKEPVTLQQLVDEYVTHLRHHVHQILPALAQVR
jgi:hypothetical protein